MRKLLGFLLLTVLLCGKAFAQAPPPYFGTNPTPDQIRAKLVAAGQAHHIPPHLLFGIAFQESGWAQYDANGRTKYHNEDKGYQGVGIMQITVLPTVSDYQRLCTDVDYNIERGAQILDDKWNITPIIGDGVGMNGREKLENWYYSVWGYNGFTQNCTGYIYCNDPRDVPRASTYQGKVFDTIANCPNGQWQSVRITEPTNAQIGPPGSYPQAIPNTPAPVHSDANFDGVIDGTPTPTDIYVDAANNGIQDGSAGHPYKTVTAAVTSIAGTQSVILHIRGGNYLERVTIHKNIRLVNNGGGIVRIGP